MSFFRGILDQSCQHPECRRESLPGFYQYYCEVHTCTNRDCGNSREDGYAGCQVCTCKSQSCRNLIVKKGKSYCIEHLCHHCKERQLMPGFSYCKTCICRQDNCPNLKSLKGKYCEVHLCTNCLNNFKRPEDQVCVNCICEAVDCNHVRESKRSNFCDCHRCPHCNEKKAKEEKYCESCLCGDCGENLREVRFCEWRNCRGQIRDDFCRECSFTRFCKDHECRYKYCHEPVKIEPTTGLQYVTCLRCHSMRGRERCSRSSVEGSFACGPCNKRRRLQ